jgi:O-antigen biosynthesis protein
VNAPPDLSVVVPTRDRPESLARSLAALEGQQTDATLEIVVVDDASAAAEDVARVVASSPSARLVRHPEPRGASAARGAGARAALAPLVAYTDDDCVPEPDWAQRLLRAFDRGADAVAGATVDASVRNPYDAASQLIVNFLVARATNGGSGTSFAPSSNVACRAAVLHAVPFDDRFRGFGEDRDWCARLVAAGYSLHVEPAAVVWHHQGLDFRRFWRKHVVYGRGAYDFRRLSTAPREFEPAGFYVDLVRTGFESSVSVGALVSLAQVATVAGFARQALADRLAR